MRQHPSGTLAILAGIASAVGVVLLLILTLPLGTDPQAARASTPAGATRSIVTGPGTASPSATASEPPAAVSVTPTPSLPGSTPTVPVTPLSTEPPEGLEVGFRAPDFELPAPDGTPTRLSDFRGRPVWINFWAPWCPACRTEMPRIEGIWHDYREAGLVVLGVAVSDTRQNVVEFAEQVSATYPIVIDPDGHVAGRYGALALPVHFWIDRKGIVREWAFGELPPDFLEATARRIVAP